MRTNTKIIFFAIGAFVFFLLIIVIRSSFLQITQDNPTNQIYSSQENYSPYDLSNSKDTVTKKYRNRVSAVASDDQPKTAKVVSIVAENGLLTSSTIKHFDLSTEDAIFVQNNISSHLKQLELKIANKAIYVESESQPESGVFVYQINCLGEERTSILDSLKSTLATKLPTKGEAIFSAFVNDPGNRQKLVGLGQYDAKIKFHPNESGDSNIVSLSYTDPTSGKLLFSSTRTIESFKEIFGDAFVFDHANSK